MFAETERSCGKERHRDIERENIDTKSYKDIESERQKESKTGTERKKEAGTEIKIPRQNRE